MTEQAAGSQVESEQVRGQRLGLLTDHAGKPSSMRWMSVGCVVWAILLSAYMVIYDKTGDTNVQLVLIFLVAGLAPKTFQAFAEKMAKRG